MNYIPMKVIEYRYQLFDDKLYIPSDGINTLPYGHKYIPKNKQIRLS